MLYSLYFFTVFVCGTLAKINYYKVYCEIFYSPFSTMFHVQVCKLINFTLDYIVSTDYFGEAIN